MLGRAKCKILKEIRQKIADENDIPYVTRECTYQGDCSGTCPRCESELRYLERELEARTRIGKQVAVTALCAGISFGSAACSGPGVGQDLGGAAELPPEELCPTVSPDVELEGEVADPGYEELAGAAEFWEDYDTENVSENAASTPEHAFDELGSFATTFNTGTVSDGALYCPLFEAQSDIQLRALTTYHWNGGKGAAPGEIRIYDVTDGKEELLGTWEATSREGSGVENVNWDIFPDITLKAGHTYHIKDSDAASWSYNADSDEMGFVELFTDDGAEAEGRFYPCNGN
ncbi:MAG: hypothetical protein IK115_12090 [Lachnospiraceae bacterium]|nr:hypothetical protein [Lachnospiraceae bacterium]